MASGPVQVLLSPLDPASFQRGIEVIDGLAGVKNEKGTVVFVCGKCGALPEEAYGAQNRDQLAYILICSRCSRVFGEWTTIEERDRELREFAERLAVMT
jgi:hypothetical protein